MATSYCQLNTLLRSHPDKQTLLSDRQPLLLSFIWRNLPVYVGISPSDDKITCLMDIKVDIGALPYRAEDPHCREQFRKLLRNQSSDHDGEYLLGLNKIIQYHCKTLISYPQSIADITKDILITLYAVQEKTVPVYSRAAA